MAVQTLPLDIDLAVYTGTNFRREFRWLPDGLTPVNFTGWSATMLIGPTRGTAVIALTSDNGGIVLTTAGQILIGMMPAQTRTLPTGTLAYNLDVTDPTGFTERLLNGRVTVVRGVEPA